MIFNECLSQGTRAGRCLTKLHEHLEEAPRHLLVHKLDEPDRIRLPAFNADELQCSTVGDRPARSITGNKILRHLREDLQIRLRRTRMPLCDRRADASSLDIHYANAHRAVLQEPRRIAATQQTATMPVSTAPLEGVHH